MTIGCNEDVTELDRMNISDQKSYNASLQWNGVKSLEDGN